MKRLLVAVVCVLMGSFGSNASAARTPDSRAAFSPFAMDFLQRTLPRLVADFSKSNGRSLKVVSNSVAMTTPRFTSALLETVSLGGSQTCSLVEFEVLDGANRYRTRVYLFASETDEQSHFLSYSTNYSGVLTMSLTGGCLGLNQVQDPSITLVPVE